MHKYYKIKHKGEKKPIKLVMRSGPLYRGVWCNTIVEYGVFDNYMYSQAWGFFTRMASAYSYNGLQLWFHRDLIAEAFINPHPVDDYDIYRIRLYGRAPKLLRDYIIKEINKGKSFVQCT